MTMHHAVYYRLQPVWRRALQQYIHTENKVNRKAKTSFASSAQPSSPQESPEFPHPPTEQLTHEVIGGDALAAILQSSGSRPGGR